MPLQATSGAASYDAFGGGAAAEPNYIESCFSTWLYTGNGSTRTITNGIDLAGKGGLVWTKSRNNAISHALIDTTRGLGRILSSNLTGAQSAQTVDTLATITGFTSSGYTLGTDAGNWGTNFNGYTYASWTFRKQPKFFDVVTWTGNSTSGTTIPHNLGSAPGCVIIKSTSDAFDWYVYHRSLGAGNFLNLNLTAAATASEAMFGPGNPAPSSTVITLGNSNATNGTGKTYVAYLFAHNAGGFGLTGTDNVISCGSVTTNGSGVGSVNLGWEPQWVLVKVTNTTNDWRIIDNMRGFTATYIANGSLALRPNTTAADSDASYFCNSTGFTFDAGASQTFIYIAIRRGPMKTPTSGTSVFTPYQVPASPTTGAITGFVTDAGFIGQRAGADKFYWGARLMGNPTLNSTNTNAESANTNQIWDRMNGWWNTAINNYMTWGFARAPGFFDVVCYTGNSTAGRQVTHNLGIPPEFLIVKRRSGADSWYCYAQPLGNTYDLLLDSTRAATNTDDIWYSTSPTGTTFTVRQYDAVNGSGQTYVAYLFATVAGVSKVGSYTGNGSSQTINCGFTGGARFVMVKRTDSAGNWMVVDTARGLVSAGDPTLYLNSAAAEVTGVDWLDPDSSGFIVNQEGTMNANVTSATYIYLAIS